MWLLAMLAPVLGAILVVWLACLPQHEVYDDRGGGVKVRCPGEGQRTVYGSVVVCPFCGVKLKRPRKPYRWERRW